MRKLLLAFAVVVMSFAVLPGVNARAVTEDYPSRFLPIVEVKINVGNTQFEDEAFLNAIIADLKIRGLGASKIDVGYAGSIETDFSVTDPENWVMFDHFGWWDEIGGVTDIWDMFETYLEENIEGYDPSDMYLEDALFDLETKSMTLEYYDGSDYQYVEYMDLSSLYNRIRADITDFDVHGWINTLEDDAETLIMDSDLASLGIDYIDDMWYETATGTAYVGWWDYEDHWHQIPFQAFEDYITATGFFDSTVLDSSGFYDDYGYLQFYISSEDCSVNVEFSPVEYGGVAPTHYPHPDENPDGDEPENWTNDPHIVIRDDGQVAFYGYGAPAFKDFMLSVDDAASDKHFAFDLDESKVDYHSMEGGGFLFSINVNDQETESTSDDTMSGYAVLFTEDETNLYQLTDVNVADFHDTEDYGMENISGISLIETGDKDRSSDQHRIKIDLVEGRLTVLDNDVVALDGIGLETIGNRFGPLVSYASHGCSQLSWFVYDNLKMGTSIKVVSKAQDNVGTIQWTEGAYHVYINLEDTNDQTLDVAAFVSALDGVDYIGIGLTESSTMHVNIIDGNELGQYFELSPYPESQEDKTIFSISMGHSIADYIWPLLEPLAEENLRNAEPDKVVLSDLPYKPIVTIPDGVIDDFYDELKTGWDVEVHLEINLLDLESVPEEDQSLYQAYRQSLAGNNAIFFYYLDFSMYKVVIADGEQSYPVSESLKPVTIQLIIPVKLRSMTDFKIVRVHNGKTEVLQTTYDPDKHTLTFTTDKFSTYAIQYNDPNALPDTGEAANLGWLFAIGGLFLIWVTKRHQVD